ncbi:MAG: glucosamine--fructose-6-phosphate aminotransferase [Sedimenticola sp.]|nr:glucosamine--fructose-6-phosphate aminotransferase [Sedimenticola sp.]
MVILQQALQDWATADFEASLKTELMALDPGLLPLQKGVNQGGYVDASNLELSLLSANDNGGEIAAKVGLFFSEIIAGCSCGDDPVTEAVYCEMNITIEKLTAVAHIELT